jgi:dihydrofolate reductase
MSSVGLIWAQSKEGVIGDHGGMPWHVPEDLAHFAAVTKGHPVVMGRKTWDSIPSKYRPFSERTNIVVTRQAGWEAEGAVVVHSLDHALKEASDAPGGELTWLIGGGELFAQALGRPEVARAVVTFLDLAVGGDTFAPELGPEWRVESADPSEAGWHESRTATRYRFVEFTRA